MAEIKIQYQCYLDNCKIRRTWNDPTAQSLPPAPTPEFTETHVRWVGDAIQPSHPISPPSPLAPPLTFCSVIQAFNRWWMPPALVRVILTQFDSNASNLFWKQPHRYSLKQCVPAIWASLSPAKMTHKIKYQRRGRECGHLRTLFLLNITSPVGCQLSHPELVLEEAKEAWKKNPVDRGRCNLMLGALWIWQIPKVHSFSPKIFLWVS